MIIRINDAIYLSPFNDDDLPSLVKYLNDKSVGENTFIPQPYTEQEGRQWIHFNQHQFKIGNHHHWAIRNEDKELIGGIGIKRPPETYFKHIVEVGYWLGAPFRGQSIMPISLKVFTQWIIEIEGFTKVFAPIFDFNIASKRAAEKAGYIYEATLKQHYIKNGKFLDGIIYSYFKNFPKS